MLYEVITIFGQQALSAFFTSLGISAKTEPDFELMAQAWETIRAEYVDRDAVKPQKMTYGAIAGMVEALGDTDHSSYNFV